METPSQHSFYKILMDLTTKLGLPEEFTKKYGDMLPKTAKLKIASGATWDVKVSKLKEGGYFFTRGWSKFCQDMELQMLEILVFSYADNSTFHVSVYATTAFEKDSNFRVVEENNLSFQVLFKKSHLNKLYVAAGFVEASGLINKRKVRLEYAGGKKAQAVLNSCMSNGRPVNYIGLGWMAFQRANKMTVGKMYSIDFIPSKKVIRVEPVR